MVSNQVSRSVNKSVGLLVAILTGAVTLIAVFFLIPEMEAIIEEAGAEEVDIPGFGLLESLGPFLIVFGAVLGIMVMILLSVVETADLM